MPLSTLRPTSLDADRKTRGQDGFATSFPVGILPPLQHAGLSRRSPVSRQYVQNPACFLTRWGRIWMMMAKKPNCKQRVHAPGIALGAGFLLAFASGLTFRANAQIEVFKPLHLSRVQGVVADTSGRPVANAEVALVGDLVGDEAVGFKTTTDDAGRFALDQTSGRYWLRVSGSRYSPAAREVVIGPDLETLFHK